MRLQKHIVVFAVAGLVLASTGMIWPNRIPVFVLDGFLVWTVVVVILIILRLVAQAWRVQFPQERDRVMPIEPERTRLEKAHEEQKSPYDHVGFIAPPGTPCPDHGPYEGETCPHAICWDCGSDGCFCDGETGVCLFPVRWVRDTARIIQPYQSEGRQLPRARWTA